MRNAAYCPVVHTGLNWIVIALLLVLIASILVGLAASVVASRRSHA